MGKRVRSLLFAVGFPLLMLGQQTGTLRLLIDPGHNFEFIVDHKQRMQAREIKLSEGLHHFSFWAPERVVVDTTFFVVADRTTDMVLRLPYSAEYKTYRAELGRFQTKKRLVRTLPMLALAGGGIWSAVATVKYGKAAKALDDDRENYRINVDPAVINKLKDETIPTHNTEMKKARTMLYSAAAFTGLSAVATFIVWKISGKKQAPELNDQQKVIFDGMSWTPGVDGGLFLCGLKINLAQ